MSPIKHKWSKAIFGAALALSMPSIADAGKNASEQVNQTEIVPLYISRNRPLAMLRVGDGPPSPVVFDTGTDDNILEERYAKRFGLKKVGSSPLFDGAGHSTTVPVVAIPHSSLSGVILDQTTTQILDREVEDEVGIFGPNSFGDRLVIIEGELNRLRILPRASGLVVPGPGTPYPDSLPAIPITINGLSVMAVLDSGNDSSLVLSEELLGKVKLKSPARVVAVAKTVLGSHDIMGGELDGEVQIGPIRLTNPEVMFGGVHSGGNVGFPLIRKLNVILDPANKRSWVLDPSIGPGPLSAFTGQFGPRSIRAEGDKLIHQREGRPAFELKHLGADLFEMPATGDRIQFFRKDGRVIRLELITAEGDVAPADRTS